MQTAWSQRLGINLLLSVLSVGAFLGGSEFLARLQYEPQQDDGEGMFIFDGEKGFQMRADFTGTFEGKPFTTNSFGQRSPEITVKKPRGTKRVLVLGDSISFGHGVSDSEPYPRLLEDTLSTYGRGQEEGTVVQVINTAAPMNFPLQEYYDLKRGLRFDPDAVVLQLTLNDVFDAPAIDEVPLSQHIDFALKEKSALYLFLKDMYGRVRFGDPTGENLAKKAKRQEILSIEKLLTEPNDPDVVLAWEETLGWVGKMVTLAKEENIPFILMVTPFVFQLDSDEQLASPQREFRLFAKEQDIPFVDVLDAMKILFADALNPTIGREQISQEMILESLRTDPEKKTAFWNSLFLDYDHPTPYGHELISSLLYSFLLDALDL